jgi:hypothetical protein
MRIAIQPVTVEDAVCVEADASVAVSSTVAVRVVPVDPDGGAHPEASFGVVGGADDPATAAFLATVAEATGALLTERGH